MSNGHAQHTKEDTGPRMAEKPDRRAYGDHARTGVFLTIPPILMGVNMNGNASTAKEHADASLALRKKERERILQRAREYNLRLA